MDLSRFLQSISVSSHIHMVRVKVQFIRWIQSMLNSMVQVSNATPSYWKKTHQQVAWTSGACVTRKTHVKQQQQHWQKTPPAARNASMPISILTLRACARLALAVVLQVIRFCAGSVIQLRTSAPGQRHQARPILNCRICPAGAWSGAQEGLDITLTGILTFSTICFTLWSSSVYLQVVEIPPMLLPPVNPKTQGQRLELSSQVQKKLGMESDLIAEKIIIWMSKDV